MLKIILQKRKKLLTYYFLKIIYKSIKSHKKFYHKFQIFTLYFKKKLIEFYDHTGDPVKHYFLDKMQQVIFNFNKSAQKLEAEKFIAKQSKSAKKKQNSIFLPINKNQTSSKRNLEIRQKMRRQELEKDEKVEREQKDLQQSLQGEIQQLREKQVRNRQTIRQSLENQSNNIQVMLKQRRERSINKSMEKSYLLKSKDFGKSQHIKKVESSQNFEAPVINIYDTHIDSKHQNLSQRKL